MPFMVHLELGFSNVLGSAILFHISFISKVPLPFLPLFRLCSTHLFCPTHHTQQLTFHQWAVAWKPAHVPCSRACTEGLIGLASSTGASDRVAHFLAEFHTPPGSCQLRSQNVRSAHGEVTLDWAAQRSEPAPKAKDRVHRRRTKRKCGGCALRLRGPCGRRGLSSPRCSAGCVF